MNTHTLSITRKVGFAIGAAILALLTGCVEGPSSGYVAVQSGPRYDSVFGDSDDYVYYPDYQVYYGRRTNRYYYQDGSAWVARPQPPQISARVLLSTPSINVDFHDSPARHHTEVVRKYPKHSNRGQDKKDDRKDNDRR